MGLSRRLCHSLNVLILVTIDQFIHIHKLCNYDVAYPNIQNVIHMSGSHLCLVVGSTSWSFCGGYTVCSLDLLPASAYTRDQSLCSTTKRKDCLGWQLISIAHRRHHTGAQRTSIKSRVPGSWTRWIGFLVQDEKTGGDVIDYNSSWRWTYLWGRVGHDADSFGCFLIRSSRASYAPCCRSLRMNPVLKQIAAPPQLWIFNRQNPLGLTIRQAVQLQDIATIYFLVVNCAHLEECTRHV